MLKYHGITTLSRNYAEKHKVTLEEARETIKNVMNIIEEGVCDPNYDGVQIVNSFTFRRVNRKAKVGRDLNLKTVVQIPPRVGVKLDLGKELFAKLNN